jgi:hypothetical protein
MVSIEGSHEIVLCKERRLLDDDICDGIGMRKDENGE